MSFDMYLEGIGEPDVTNGEFLTFGGYQKHVSVRGIQKLIVRFLKCFMTPLGTDITDLDYGTTLLVSFTGNNDPTSLRSLASRAVTEAVENLQRYDAEYDRDDDERIFDVEINDLIVDEVGSSVVLYLTLQNAEGTTALISVPVIEEQRNG